MLFVRLRIIPKISREQIPKITNKSNHRTQSYFCNKTVSVLKQMNQMTNLFKDEQTEKTRNKLKKKKTEVWFTSLTTVSIAIQQINSTFSIGNALTLDPVYNFCNFYYLLLVRLWSEKTDHAFLISFISQSLSNILNDVSTFPRLMLL